jgi:hypothetical protein
MCAPALENGHENTQSKGWGGGGEVNRNYVSFLLDDPKIFVSAY